MNSRPTRYKRNISSLFPYIHNKNLCNKLKIDYDSIRFISNKDIALKITQIIISHLPDIFIDPKNVVLTDATAGVGGNTISFAMHFDKINAIEIDKIRSSYLQNNIGIYNLTNVKVHTGDCNDILPNLKQDIVFIDPPWGGVEHKNYKNIRLLLSNIPIETVCNNIFDPTKMDNLTKMIVLKLSKNYDIRHLYNSVSGCHTYLHELEKMYIVVIIKL